MNSSDRCSTLSSSMFRTTKIDIIISMMPMLIITLLFDFEKLELKQEKTLESELDIRVAFVHL